MFLARPDPTPLDISFTLFRTRVRIHPGYWLLCLFFGWGFLQPPHRFSQNGVPEFGLWALAMTLSILLHEYGHILAGWAFGGKGEVLLHGMGGLAIHEGVSFSRWQHILVALAGPGIQLLLFAALYFGLPAPDRIKDRSALGLFHEQMLRMNILWPLLNLLPIWPLDGGQVTRQLCLFGSRQRGVEVSLWLSVILCVALAANALLPTFKVTPVIPYLTGEITAMIFALFAVTAWTELQARSRPRRVFDDPW